MKVSILGDNLVSLSLAKTLINEGIYVDLIYFKHFKSISTNRTIGIAKSNIDFFNKDILDVSKLIWNINNIKISLEKFKKETIIDFSDDKEQLFSILKNHKLYELLNKSLKKNKFFKKKKFTNKLKILDKNELVINCDSFNPFTKKFFYKKINKNYQGVSFVTIIKHKKVQQNEIAYQTFTKFGPIAFLPISKNETSIVYSVKKKHNLNDENIKDLIRKYNPRFSIIKIGKIENFDLRSTNLRVYYYKNILAFGDLLHKIHPLAGQGFNMTIRDIKQLKKIIKQRLSLGLEINNSICFDFERKIKHKNFLFSSGIDFVYEFFNLERNIKSKRLGHLIKFFAKNKYLINFFNKVANHGI